MLESGLLHREHLPQSSFILPPCPSDATSESHLENSWARFSERVVSCDAGNVALAFIQVLGGGMR